MSVNWGYVTRLYLKNEQKKEKEKRKGGREV
jgi:hypothetical protein